MPDSKNPPITDDQNTINFCLEHMAVQWTNYNKSERIEERSKVILGSVSMPRSGRGGGEGGGGGGGGLLKVMLMPYTIVCRHVCDVEKKDSYYVWHALAIRNERTVANKRKQATVGGAWYLHSNWKELSRECPELKVEEWLRYISAI